MKHFFPFLVILSGFDLSTAWAEVKLPSIFGNHMVLQQEKTLPVWGWADPGEKVTVSFGNVHGEAVTGADGKWKVALTALRAGTAAGNLVISGKNTVTLTDVLVGDIWVCAGQSNMEYGLANATGGKDEVVRATDGTIRLFVVPHRDGIKPCDDVGGSWQVCSPQTVGGFSAVGYFFAKDLRRSLTQPLGLIETAWGGSTAQAWTDQASLEKARSNPTLQRYMDGYQDAVNAYPGGQAELDAKVVEQSANGKEPPANRRTPTMLYNGMLAPLTPFAIKGVAWYQGEDNTGVPMAYEYRDLLPTLISSWRSAFAQGDFPFLIVQLPNFGKPAEKPVEASPWAVLRESQLKTLSVANTGLAVTIDLGDGQLHPPDKSDVGVRLALVARHVAYGEHMVYSGPIYDSMKIEGNAIRINFRTDSVGSGLVIGTSPRDPAAKPGDNLHGFAIAGSDQKWIEATAKINGNEVVVANPLVPVPVAVRYGWAQNPTTTLYNRQGLPASPFRTDDWPPFQ